MKKIAISAMVMMCILVLGSGAWATLLDRDVIVVGTEAAYPPYQSRDVDGNPIGFDIDLVHLIADKLGKQVEWRDMAFDALVPSLITRYIDAIAAGFSITPERAEHVLFSRPYEASASAFIVQAGSPIGDLDALYGKNVAVQIGTVQETFAHTLPGVTVMTFLRSTDCAQEVLLGRVDAALLDVPVAREFVGHREFAGRLEIAFRQTLAEGGKALAFHLDETEFVAAVNKVLDEIEASGQLTELRKKWNMDDDVDM